MKLSETNEMMYEEFQGLPSYAPIVRNNQLNDAFVMTVLKLLYEMELDLEFDASQVQELSKYVIAPPDAGIDIFVEHVDEDDVGFDIVQVKYKAMRRNEIKEAFAMMKRTINDFCNDVSSVNSISCREILSSSSLCKSNKKKCHYYVVHIGDIDTCNLRNNETVINGKYLNDILMNGNNKVKSASFYIEKNNVMNHDIYNLEQNAIVVELNCYDLALLNNKFDKAKIGRNILFGQNFRDGLGVKKSNTYEAMKNTIINEPDKFWYYNNGMTIVADSYCISSDKDGREKVILKDFSIVNGAQTTSTLGCLVKSFSCDKEINNIDSIKKASVLTRIVCLKNLDVRRNVALYNNNQNAILKRDIVANQPEQILLYERLLHNRNSAIYMEIRRGTRKPLYFNKKYKHRITKNETLAQIAYAAFEIEPNIAKGKKNEFFSCNNSNSEYKVNEYYDRIFNYDERDSSKNGILFKKSVESIDEALFSMYLYTESSNLKRKEVRQSISDYKKGMLTTDNPARLQENIDADSNVFEAVGSCRFYCISTYYLFKERFDVMTDKRIFNYEKFYSDKEFKKHLICDFANLFLMTTVRILIKNAHENNKSGNIANWVRGKSCQDVFITSLKSELTLNPFLKETYLGFVSKYKL